MRTEYDPIVQNGRAAPTTRKGQMDAPAAGRASGCRDTLWAVLFVAHLIAVLAIGAYFFSQYESQMFAGSNSFSLNTEAWTMIALVVGGSVAIAVLYVSLLRMFTKTLVWMSLVLMPCLSLAIGLYMMASGEMGGVILLIVAALSFLFLYCVRDRVPLTITLIEIVLHIVDKYSSMLVVAFLTIAIQLIWVVVWIITLISVYYAYNPDGGSSNSPWGAIIGLVLSFFWTFGVIKNLLHCTIAGTTGTWYFYHDDELAVHAPNPTWSAFKRAASTSLGSVAFGSLLVAVVQTIRFILDQAIKNEFGRCVVNCICGCIEGLLEALNFYAFIFVALYGLTFCEAGERVRQTTGSNQLWNIIISYDLVNWVCGFGSILGGLGVGLLAGGLSALVWSSSSWLSWGLIGLMVGMAVTYIALTIIWSATATLFICWIQEPHLLNGTHPAQGARLNAVMDEIRRSDNEGCCGGRA